MPIDVATIELFALVFIRIASALAVLPVFSHSSVPQMAKAGLAAILALLVVGSVAPGFESHSASFVEFFRLALMETIVGLLIGYVGHFAFYAVEIAGQIIGYQAGFTFVGSIDPATESESMIISQFYHVLAMLIFLTINGHHWMIQGLVDSYRQISIGGLGLQPDLLKQFIELCTTVIKDGIRLAAPIMITLLITDLCLGFLTRVAPSLNIFVLGIPVKVGLTLIMLSAGLQLVAISIGGQFMRYADVFQAWLKLLSRS